MLHQESRRLAEAIETKAVPLIEEVIDGYGLAGIAFGVVSAGEVIFARGFGKRNIETYEPVTERSLFHVASVSKPFVATAILQLWERGQLELDAPLTDALPTFSILGGDVDQITVRRLLTHTSGLPDTDDTSWRNPAYDDGALERYVGSLSGETLVAAPGERYAYSNIAYNVLGHVIAEVSGQTFEAYVKEHILQPLGMHDSTFLLADVPDELATTPHYGAPLTVLEGAYSYNRPHAPSGSLHASIHDMCSWMSANLAKGTLDGKRILQESTYDLLWQPVTRTGSDDPLAQDICLGWFRGVYKELPIIYHGGSDPGFWSDLSLQTEQQFGLLALANSFCATGWGATDMVMDVLVGREPTKPKRPITVPVGEVLAASGQEAAVAEYRRLQAEAPDDYDFDEDHFRHATESALWVNRPDAVLPLMEVWRALYPQSFDVHEQLGLAYLLSGDTAAAKQSLKQAFELEPDSESVPKLMQRLARG